MNSLGLFLRGGLSSGFVSFLYTYILNIYDLVWLGFMAYQPL